MAILLAYLSLAMAIIIVAYILLEVLQPAPSLLDNWMNSIDQARIHAATVRTEPVFVEAALYDPQTKRWRHPVTKRFVKAPQFV